MRHLRRDFGKLLRKAPPFGHRTFDLVRFDLECALQRFANFLSRSYRRRIRSLRQRSGLSINVGSGGTSRDGWVNIDARPAHRDILFTHDIRRPLPLKRGCARRIFAEHVVEHLDFLHDVPKGLLEFHRRLEPGGIVRIVVPDAQKHLQAYVSRDWTQWGELEWNRETWPADIVTPMHAINHIFHQGGARTTSATTGKRSNWSFARQGSPAWSECHSAGRWIRNWRSTAKSIPGIPCMWTR